MYKWYKHAEQCYAYLCDVFTFDARLAFNCEPYGLGPFDIGMFLEYWFSQGNTLSHLLESLRSQDSLDERRSRDNYVELSDCRATINTVWQNLSPLVILQLQHSEDSKVGQHKLKDMLARQIGGNLYLLELLPETRGLNDLSHRADIIRSQWFSRGWTLQELLAPSDVVFFNAQWQYLGKRSHMEEIVHEATGIRQYYVDYFVPDHRRPCVAEIMSWASQRKTTRVEDRAYCLLGLFGISIPMLYGEGNKAFMRLQEEILRTLDDQSLFLWSSKDMSVTGLLAKDPEYFAGIDYSDRYLQPATFERRNDTVKSSQSISLELATRYIDGRTILAMTHAIISGRLIEEQGQQHEKIVGLILRRLNFGDKWTRLGTRYLDCIISTGRGMIATNGIASEGFYLQQITVLNQLKPIERENLFEEESNSFRVSQLLLPDNARTRWFDDHGTEMEVQNGQGHNFEYPARLALLIDFGLDTALARAQRRLSKFALGFDRAFVPMIFLQLQTRPDGGGIQSEELDNDIFDTTHDSPEHFSKWTGEALPLDELHISTVGCSMKVYSNKLWSCRMDQTCQYDGRGMTLDLATRPRGPADPPWLRCTLFREARSLPWALTLEISGKPVSSLRDNSQSLKNVHQIFGKSNGVPYLSDTLA